MYLRCQRLFLRSKFDALGDSWPVSIDFLYSTLWIESSPGVERGTGEGLLRFKSR